MRGLFDMRARPAILLVMDAHLLERAKNPLLRVGRAILDGAVDDLPGRFALVSQPGPMAQLDDRLIRAAAVVLEAESLDEPALLSLVHELPDVEHIVGIGGGMVMDTAKYLAWKGGLPLLLAPSIISVDACVTNTIAVRRNGTVEYDGFVVADAIVADLALIATAPARLNRAGVGDLLSIQTGSFDWALGSKAGSIDFDARIDAAAAEVLEALYLIADEVARVTDRALEHIIRAYAAVNTLLLDAGHSGPEEGSEHYFAYAAEAVTGRSFVHGELVALGVVLMSGLQCNDQAPAADFLDRCGVEWRPESLGLEPSLLEQIILGLPAFVRRAGLPHSIIDEAAIDPETTSQLLGSIPTPREYTDATLPSQEDHV